MSYQTPAQKREGLRQYLLLATGNCNIQEGADGKSWPCGTCVLSLFNSIGLDATKPEYHEMMSMTGTMRSGVRFYRYAMPNLR